MTNKDFYKKSVSIFLVLLMLLELSFVGVSKVNAQLAVPVSDKPLEQKEVGLSLSLFGFSVGLPGTSLDSLLVVIVRSVLETLSDNVVDWINNGPDGRGPLFATDLGGFLQQSADNVAGEFINSIGLGGLCSPFRLQVQLAVQTSYNAGRSGRNPYDAQCTLSGVINNIQGFLDGDFSQGGWSGWYSLTQNVTNNPYGAVLDAQAKLSIQINNDQGLQKTLLDWGDGFMSWSECATDPVTGAEKRDANGNCTEQGPVRTPGKVISEQLNKVLGSEQDQLQLADEFDEIIAAIVTRIGASFMNRNGVISSNRYSIGGSGTGISGTVGGSCSVNTTSGIMGQTAVTWNITPIVASTSTPSFVWSDGPNGPGELSGTTASVTVTYPTAGVKSAQVIVSYTDNSGTHTQTVTCPDTVNISRYGPITGTCSPVDPIAILNPSAAPVPMYQQQERHPVGWRVEINGGSGSYTRITWDGTAPSMRGGAIGSFPQFGLNGPYPDAIRLGWTPGIGNATAPWPRVTVPGNIANNTPTIQVLVRAYDNLGDSTASVTVIDNDNTVRPSSISCTDSVYIY